MTYSYSAPLTYGQPTTPLVYDGMSYQEKKPSSTGYTIAGGLVGAGVGAYLGYKKNPFISNDNKVSDTFAKKAYDIYINKTDDNVKKIYNQGLEILKKIDDVKTPEELKSLFNNNEEAVKKMCEELRQTPEEFIRTVSQENIAQNKKTIKDRITGIHNNQRQSMKNWIETCWDKTKKKFTKPDGITDDVFDSIKKATKGEKLKTVLKYTGIGAVSTALVAYIAHKIILAKKSATNDTQQ